MAAVSIAESLVSFLGAVTRRAAARIETDSIGAPFQRVLSASDISFFADLFATVELLRYFPFFPDQNRPKGYIVLSLGCGLDGFDFAREVGLFSFAQILLCFC